MVTKLNGEQGVLDGAAAGPLVFHAEVCLVRKPHQPRFVRLSNEHAQALLGAGVQLDPWMVISGGRYVAKQRIAMIGPRGRIDGVAVVGPLVDETEISLSLADDERLGLSSEGGPRTVLLAGPAGEARVPFAS